MTHAEVKELMAEFSGVSGLATGSRATFFLNMAQVELDRMLETRAGNGRYYVELSAGGYKLELQNCRAVESVWVLDSATGLRFELEEKSLKELREAYPYEFGSGSNPQGRPLYWAYNVVRDVTPGSASFDDDDDVSADADEVKALIVMPPADATYDLVAFGKFKTAALSNDSDTTYWTKSEPYALICWALHLYFTSASHESSASSWRALAMLHFEKLDFDAIEETMREVAEAEG